MFDFAGGNPYIGIELIGFVISLGWLVISVVLISFAERKFVRYAKEYDYELWEKYKSFKPKIWWRFLYFIRPMEDTDDAIVRELRLRSLRYEKFASVAVLVAVALFTSMIITVVITEQ